MKRLTLLIAVVPSALASMGCYVPPPQTTVRLNNTTNFPVDVRLFYDENQLLPENLIEAEGVELAFVLQPGEVQSFARDCEALQAIFIKNANMRVLPGFSPEASTGVYREPDDFGCGDVLTFTFTQDALATDLDIGYAQSG